MSGLFHRGVDALVGNTPTVSYPLAGAWSNVELLLKLEGANPGRSMKDRMALEMIRAAEEDGRLRPGGVIIESSSGNTGTSLAMIAASRGYRFVAVVDGHAAKEKISVMKALGAEIVVVDDRKDRPNPARRGQIAQEIEAQTPNSVWTRQSANPSNPAGYESLATELSPLLRDGDYLYASLGTGGSLCGTSRFLALQGRSIRVVGVEPVGSTLYGQTGGYYLQSGAGHPAGTPPPETFDSARIDEHVEVSDSAAFTTCRFVARCLGVLVGGSSGGVIYSALSRLHEPSSGRRIVAITADSGERYTSTIHSDGWLQAHGLLDLEVWEFLSAMTAASPASRASKG